jgi:hypothetical protein
MFVQGRPHIPFPPDLILYVKFCRHYQVLPFLIIRQSKCGLPLLSIFYLRVFGRKCFRLKRLETEMQHIDSFSYFKL